MGVSVYCVYTVLENDRTGSRSSGAGGTDSGEAPNGCPSSGRAINAHNH